MSRKNSLDDNLGPGTYNTLTDVKVNGGRFKKEQKKPRHKLNNSYASLRESRIQIRKIPLVQPIIKIGSPSKIINMSLEADLTVDSVVGSKFSTGHSSKANMKAKKTFSSMINSKKDSQLHTLGRVSKSTKYGLMEDTA